MKIYYFSFTRFPSEKAHALYLAKVAESFATIPDVQFVLVVPKRLKVSKETAETFFNLRHKINVKKLACLDVFEFLALKKVAFYIGIFSFSISSFLYALRRIQKDDLVVTNDALVGWMLTYVNKKVIYELHDYPVGSLWLYRRLFKRAYKIQTNNFQKKNLLNSQFEISQNKITVAHNGVTIGDFDIELSQLDARTQLGLSKERKLAVYTGHLYDWKGVDTLAETATVLGDIDVLFVGGTEKDVIKMKEQYKTYTNITFLGFKPHKDIPLYQRAADVLILPNTAKKEISRLHTSPMKVFEYMASKTLIVASDIPSIREVLNDTNAILVEPDSVSSLAKGIELTLSLSQEKKNTLTTKAFSDVLQFSWENRALKIINVDFHL